MSVNKVIFQELLFNLIADKKALERAVKFVTLCEDRRSFERLEWYLEGLIDGGAIDQSKFKSRSFNRLLYKLFDDIHIKD